MKRCGIELCESPLEEKLARAFAELARWEWRTPAHHQHEIGRWPGWFLSLVAQLPVGPYRADLAIVSYTGLDPDPPFLVVVEVDGHDFHERTPAQASRDKARDRYLQRRGAKVLRFTGRDVYHDAEACALEAIELAMELQDQHLNDLFAAHLRRRAAEIKSGGTTA